MQSIRPNPQDGSGYPPSKQYVLCRRYVDTDDVDEPYYAYRILSWRGEYWLDRQDNIYGVGWANAWVFLDAAFETYNDINNN